MKDFLKTIGIVLVLVFALVGAVFSLVFFSQLGTATLTIDCAKLRFDEAGRFYSLYSTDDEHAACLVAAARDDIEKVKQAYDTISPEQSYQHQGVRYTSGEKALSKWLTLSEKSVKNIHDCNSAKESAKVVEK